MGKYRDLSGQKFNRLNVIKPDDDYIAPSGRHIKRWICLCDCQLNLPEDQRKYISVNGSALVTGHTKSCGCYISSDEYKQHRREDLTGYTFGKYTVVKPVEKPDYLKQSCTYWLCRCECGRERIISASHIKQGDQMSCGQCNGNTYVEKEDYYIGYTHKNEPYYFDKEYFELIQNYTWYFDSRQYVVARDKLLHRQVFMHRLICGLSKGDKYDVDHMNHQNFDNRKSNLRVCPHRDNGRNLSLKKNNKSGITGVRYVDTKKKWMAEISVNYKRITLGYFDNLSDAIKCRKEAENKYFGEYSYDNSISNGAKIIKINNER